MRWFFRKATSSPAQTLLNASTVHELGPREITALSTFGKIKKYESGEYLFREGDRTRNTFLVVKGSFRVTGDGRNNPRQSIIFGKGDWIAEGTYLKSAQKLSSVIARESSAVLTLDEAALSSLDRSLETYILKKTHDLACSEMQKLSALQESSSAQGQYLQNYIARYVDEKSRAYDHSEMLQTMFNNLPSLPMHTNRIVQLITDEEASPREVTEVAREDPSLVSQILKTINSAYYSLSQQISDIQYAITYLGFNQVYQIVVSNGMRKIMPRTREFQELHDHSVIISHLVFMICQHYDRRKSSTSSTIALLHDIGRSVVLLLKKQNPKLAFFIGLLDTSEIGTILLRAWNLPEAICQTIKYQKLPEFMPPERLPTEYKDNVALLYIAHAAYEYLAGNTPEDAPTNPFLDDYMKMLRFSGISMEELVERCILSNGDGKINTLPRHVRTFILGHRKQPAKSVAFG